MLKLPLLLVLRVRYLDLLGRVPRPRNLGRVPTGPHFFGEGEREIPPGLALLGSGETA